MKPGTVLLVVLAACGKAEPGPALPPAGQGPLVAFLGDSLTAGLGLAAEEAWPAVLGAELERSGHPIRVLNAGVSGDTTAGGRSRVDWILAKRPDALVVALGANDGLRGRPVEEIERNLDAIVARALEAGVPVLLAGMKLPPDYGPDYARSFEAVFPRVAASRGVPLVPFLLEGVAGVPALNQADGLHPTAAGQARVAATVLPFLRSLLDSSGGNTSETSGS